MNHFTTPYKKRQVPKRQGSLVSLSDVLPQVCDDLRLDQKVNELAFLALWTTQMPALLGQAAVSQSKPLYLKKQGKKRILWVKVAHAALAAELSFQLSAIQSALNAFSPQTGITIDQIQWLVGTV